MGRSRSRRDSGSDTSDRLGFEVVSRLSAVSVLAGVVPSPIARRAIAVSVTTDRGTYDRDEPVEITVEFKNRLPVPVELTTSGQRRWGWTVDGELEASDERLYTRDRPASFDFRGGERKRLSVTWNGRLERTRSGNRRESVVPEPGEYEIRAFVATRKEGSRPTDSTTITVQ